MKRYNRLFVLFFSFFLLTGCKLIKNSKPYQMSIRALEGNAKAVEALGGISGYGWFPKGDISAKNGSGKASFSIKVKGENQDGLLVSSLIKEKGNWKLKEAVLKTTNGKKIDLLEYEQYKGLRVLDTFFSKEPWKERMENPKFRKDETVYYHVVTTGLEELSNGKYAFGADLKVVDPNGEVVLLKKDILEGMDKFKDHALPINFNIDIMENSADGEYTAEAVIKDLVSGKTVTVTRQFHVYSKDADSDTNQE